MKVHYIMSLFSHNIHLVVIHNDFKTLILLLNHTRYTWQKVFFTSKRVKKSLAWWNKSWKNQNRSTFFQHCLWLCRLGLSENQILGDTSKIERINQSPFLSPCIVVGWVSSFTAVQQSGLVSRVRLLFSPQFHNTVCFWLRLWLHTSSHVCFYRNLSYSW